MRLFCLFFILFVGCGAPPTPDEVVADDMLQDFVAECKVVYGNRCDVPMVINRLIDTSMEDEREEVATCWTETGNPIRSVTLYKKHILQDNKEAIYEMLFMCTLNLGNFEKKSLDFKEFAVLIGLINE